MHSFTLRTAILLIALSIPQLDAFGVSTRHSALVPAHLHSRTGRSTLQAGGFGGGGTGGGSQKKKKEKKLKPKQQWDRYSDMLKKADKIQVAVRVAGASGEWLPIGYVKSKDNQYTQVAVVRQRALIADVRTRMVEKVGVNPRSPSNNVCLWTTLCFLSVRTRSMLGGFSPSRSLPRTF